MDPRELKQCYTQAFGKAINQHPKGLQSRCPIQWVNANKDRGALKKTMAPKGGG